jgi:hypothetical protein
MISEGARRPDGLGGVRAGGPRQRGTGSSSDGTFWHITSVLNTGCGPSPARTRSLRARPCNQVPACLAIASQSSTAQPSSALHSKIAGLVFGSSTEASAARSLSWLSRAD